EKMSVWNQLLTWAVLIVVVFFCLVNVSGHSVEHVINNPSAIVHPSHTLHLPGKE
ncbi:ABC transporter ATP-binding protein, partial [Lactobacillus buchneri]|nr:ABC transporter ATP-binding protein [Lentilactobacillus buchneri]